MTKQSHILVNWTDKSVITTDEYAPGRVWVTVNAYDAAGDVEIYRGVLTEREFDVAQMVSEGLSKGRISGMMGISHTRVRQLWRAVKRKVRCVISSG